MAHDDSQLEELRNEIKDVIVALVRDIREYQQVNTPFFYEPVAEIEIQRKCVLDFGNRIGDVGVPSRIDIGELQKERPCISKTIRLFFGEGRRGHLDPEKLQRTPLNVGGSIFGNDELNVQLLSKLQQNQAIEA